MMHSSVSGISPLGSSPASASNSEHELGGHSQGEADADDEDGLTYDDYQLYLAQAGGTGIRTATAGSVQDDVLIDEMIPGYVKIRMLDTAAPATPKKRRATKPKIDRSGVEMDEDALEECDYPSPPSALCSALCLPRRPGVARAVPRMFFGSWNYCFAGVVADRRAPCNRPMPPNG